jgi:hypothetical protein
MTVELCSNDDPTEDLAWYERRSTSWWYTIQLAVWFSVLYWAVMGIPYAYDQLNRRDFALAESHGSLVVREFATNVPTSREMQSCIRAHGMKGCDEFKMLSERRLISLDYVEKLESASELSVGEFLKSAILAYVLVLVILLGLDRICAARPILTFASIFLFFSLTIFYIGFFAGLPHTNVKFYFAMGSFYAVLLPMMNYLHRIPAINGGAATKNPKAMLEVLRLAHNRWGQLLAVGFGLGVALLATVLFKVVDYLTGTFGESFSYYPLLGIITAMGIALTAYAWGILRNIYQILMEIETKLSRLQL